jgi:hypothetical protein
VALKSSLKTVVTPDNEEVNKNITEDLLTGHGCSD